MVECVTIKMFACLCGAQAEGEEQDCWMCGDKMHQWSQRQSSSYSNTLNAAKADIRTANGGYDEN